MSTSRPFEPKGIIPATLLSFNEDFSIDVPGLRRHVADVASTEGIAAICVNGHASEVFSCTTDEQKLVMNESLDVSEGRVPIVSGVTADGSIEAARLARMFHEAGAQALLVFPPQSLIPGGNLRPEMAVAHFRRIADATDLPLILFQFGLETGMGYPFETLVQLLDEVPTIRAIKDLIGVPMMHERNIRVLQTRHVPVHVLTTHSSWLLGSLSLGCNGILSGSGSIIADRHVALHRAVQAGDLPRARAINDTIYPLAQAFYSPPYLDNHNRMKHALKMLGRFESTVVRPPLCPLPAAEIEVVRRALIAAGMLAAGAAAI